MNTETLQNQKGFLRGERILLRPVENEDIPIIARWMNDGEVTRTMFTGQRPVTLSQAAEEVGKLVGNSANVVFLVEDLKNHQPIGFAGLYDFHPTVRKAEFRILIGEMSYWDQGYGTEITELVVFYGFDRLNLNRIWLGITSENQRGIRAYEKAGFRQEGVLRQDLYRNSRYYDSIRFSLLREEYYPEQYERHVKRFQGFPNNGFADKGGEK